MAFRKRFLLPATFIFAHIALSQQPMEVQRNANQNGMPSSGGYTPPALSLTELLQNDHVLNSTTMTFMQTGDSAAFKTAIFQAAQSGNVGAELFLGEQYIPEECTFEPNQDVPHCGKNGNEPPHVVFRQNPLGVEASYEDASMWLEKASAQGSGEASEVLAQLITRMQANGHGTHLTLADSAKLHQLARSQGFDIEPLSVTCYKVSPGKDGITLGRLPGLVVGQPPSDPFTPEELDALAKAGISGSLLFGGISGGGDSTLLTRPEGQSVRLRIILDHDPGAEILLPMPAHHDQIYVQRGEQFLAFPNSGNSLPRFIALEPLNEPGTHQVSVFTQRVDGGYSGGFCTRFP
jgi:hypothetical protein